MTERQLHQFEVTFIFFYYIHTQEHKNKHTSIRVHIEKRKLERNERKTEFFINFRLAIGENKVYFETFVQIPMNTIVSVEQSARCVRVCKCCIGCKRIEDCAIIRIDPMYNRSQPINRNQRARKGWQIQLHALRLVQFSLLCDNFFVCDFL